MRAFGLGLSLFLLVWAFLGIPIGGNPYAIVGFALIAVFGLIFWSVVE